MNVRYASIVVLLSSILGLGLFYLVSMSSKVGETVEGEGRLQLVVPVMPLKAVLNEFVDANKVQVESLKAAGADVHHAHLSPSQLRRIQAADVMIEPEGGDPHLWLSLEGLAAFVSDATVKLDEDTRANGQAFMGARTVWVAQQQARFQPLQNTQFIVDHDAFTGFEKDLGLTGKLGALTTGHDQAIGAKSLRELRAKAAGKSVCVLHSPHANTKRLATMLEGATLTFTEADPLLWNDPSYSNSMQRLADAFYNCLAKAAP